MLAGPSGELRVTTSRGERAIAPSWTMATVTEAQRSFYDEIGGAETFGLLVSRFYARGVAARSFVRHEALNFYFLAVRRSGDGLR